MLGLSEKVVSWQENSFPKTRAWGETGKRAPSAGVGRHSFDGLTFRAPRGAAGWIDDQRCDWTIVVGDRIRRLRRDRGLTLVQVAGDAGFSPGYVSKIERGWANAPLSAYLALAGALDVAPWRLLGPEEVQKEVTDAELTLIQYLRHLELAPHVALARLAAASAPPRSRSARGAGP
jgi:transcriptional regulator with XRE-family HTH domain